MLFGRVARGHPDDSSAAYGERSVLVGQVMARLRECLRYDAGKIPPEPELKEAFGGRIEVPGEHQTLVEVGPGGPQSNLFFNHRVSGPSVHHAAVDVDSHDRRHHGPDDRSAEGSIAFGLA